MGVPGTTAATSLSPPAAVSSYYAQQNEVTSADNLDFRHHSYKDMRQVGMAAAAPGVSPRCLPAPVLFLPPPPAADEGGE